MLKKDTPLSKKESKTLGKLKDKLRVLSQNEGGKIVKTYLVGVFTSLDEAKSEEASYKNIAKSLGGDTQILSIGK